MLKKEVHEWLQNFKKKAKVISIASGKGGVGKTTISVKLGLNLSKLGLRILLIDCDYNLSNTLIHLNLPLTNNFYQYLTKKKSFSDVLYKLDKFHLLAACNGHMDLFENKDPLDGLVQDIIDQYGHNYDVILLDCSSGIEKETLKLSVLADYRFIIASPDKSSITDAYSLMKILRLNYGVDENFLVMNRIRSEAQYARTILSLKDTAYEYLNTKVIPLGSINEIPNLLNVENMELEDSLKKIWDNFSKNQKASFGMENLSKKENVYFERS